MSFFGLTALGPQNPFQSNLIDAIGLKVFSREEFHSAFLRIDKDHSGYIDISEVRELLKETYGLDPLDIEVEMFMEEFDENHDGRITWEEFESNLTKILADLEGKAKRASQSKSYENMMFNRRKHIRADVTPHEVYVRPITYGQGYGFFDYDKVRKEPTTSQSAFFRARCAETKYADSLIAGGHHFG